MRHRRRSNSQTIQRKSHSNTNVRFSPSKKKKSKLPFLFLGLVAVVIIGFLYWPELSELIPATQSEAISNQSEIETRSEEQTSIPVQETQEPEVQYYSPIEKKIQLEILNGCGEKGVAKKLADLLKKSKYDIVNSGNYIEQGKINWQVQETKIIDQINNQENARDLADHMGILYANVEIFDNPSPIADLTVVIGKDYKLLSIFQ
ncbi:MAG: LytR C-terminal domain-containing protein [Calditrichaeota bacterium]|nr:LytR C-terminal domain-containing protein [Calditrichota bacterium]